MLDTDSVRMLADIGFMTLSQGLADEAETIFEGVVAARPSGEAGHIGLAMVRMLRGDIEAAVKTLRGLPPSDAVSTFLGLALARQGRLAEAAGRFDDVMRVAGGTPAADLAGNALRSVIARRD